MDDEIKADFAIPFSISTSLQPYRLIELPSTLVSEIQSTSSPVHLKTANGTTNGTALLCTSNQTFQLRSMQSSNLIYIAESHKSETSGETGLRAIANPKGVLELSLTTADAVGWLRTALPVFRVEGEAEFEGMQDGSGKRSKQVLMEQAPCSSGEFEEAWRKVAAFERDEVAWRPSPACCVRVWKSMYSAAVIRGIDFGKPVARGEFGGAVDEDGLPRGAVAPILSNVSSGGSIEQSKLILWLGDVLLASQGSVAMEKAAFMQQWQDLLPEKWREGATLEVIKHMSEFPDKDSIRHVQSSTDTVASKPAKKPASKWHEKLKASRR